MPQFKQTRQGYVDALIELAPEIPELVVTMFVEINPMLLLPWVSLSSPVRA